MLCTRSKDKDAGHPEIPKRSMLYFASKYWPFLFFLIPGLFYFITACRTPGWVDATLIVSNVVDLELKSWVNCHNLFHVLGYSWISLFPRTHIHYALVLLSALFGALTVQLMFLVFLELTGNRLVSAVGAIILMVSHSLWWHSTMLEVYTLNMAILAGMLLCILRHNKYRKKISLYAAAFLLGLGCSNHLLMVFFVFAFLGVVVFLLIRKQGLNVSVMAILAGCFLLGAGLYIVIFTRDYLYHVSLASSKQPLQSLFSRLFSALGATIDNATGKGFRSYMVPGNASVEERRFWRMNYIIVMVLNYPSAAMLFALFGFYSFWKKRFLRLTFLFFIIGLAAQVVWSSNFFIWDMYAFSLPVYVLLSIPMVCALQHLYTRFRNGRQLFVLLIPLLLTSPLVYTVVSNDGEKDGIVKRYFQQYPEWEQAEHTWDVVEYLINPNKRSYDKVVQYSEKIFQILPEQAHFWNSVGRADYPLRLYYRDIYRVRTDIRHHSLFNPFMNHEEAEPEAKRMKLYIENGSPVYIASLNFPERLVLDHLYLLLDTEKELDWVSGLSTDELVQSFPVYGFQKIILMQEEEVWIYRIVPKATAQQIAALPPIHRDGGSGNTHASPFGLVRGGQQ